MEMNLLDKYLGSVGPNEYPRLFIGPPGIGKTSKTRQIMQSLGYHVVIINANVTQRVDYIGIPKPVLDNEEKVKGLKGYYVNLPPQIIYDAIVQSLDKPICLIFDEVSRMPEYLQGVLFQIIDSKIFGDVRLPPDTVIIGISNPTGGGTYRLVAALRGRFSIVEVSPNIHDWTIWAVHFGIDNRIISFLQKFPQSLYIEGETSPRRWHKLSERINKNIEWSFEEEVVNEIGEHIGSKFIGFIKELPEMVDPFELISGEIEFPEKNLTLQYFTATDVTRVLLTDPALFPQFCEVSLNNWPPEIVKGVIIPNLQLAEVVSRAPDVKEYQNLFEEWCEKYGI